MNHTFVQSIKTITESLIRKAGFDKTRSGKVVGRNEITNTYAIQIDGNIYDNIRVVNDCVYNVGDTVKVSIPCNQASQMYIMSSIFSDDSIGKKIVHADSMIDALETETGSMAEIDGHIYQLNITSTYTSTSSTYTGHIIRDGEDVTSSTYWTNFHWYSLKNEGAEEIETGISHASLTMQLADYKYGAAIELIWAYSADIILRRLIILFDNEEIEQVAQTASDAYGIASNTDQYFWYTSTGTDTGGHITEVPKTDFVDNPQGYNLLTRSNGVAVRDGMNELAVFTYDSVSFNAIVDNTLTSVAEYGANGARTGRLSERHTFISGDVFSIRNPDGTEVFSVSSSRNPTDFVYTIVEKKAINETPLVISGTPITGDVMKVYIGASYNDYYDSDREKSVTYGTPATLTVTISGHDEYRIVYNGTNTFTVTVLEEDYFDQISVTYHVMQSQVDMGQITFGSRVGSVGNGSATFGNALSATEVGSAAFGQYNNPNSILIGNDIYTIVTEGQGDSLLSVGNGTGDLSRSNAFRVNKYGNIGATNMALYGEAASSWIKARANATIKMGNLRDSGSTIGANYVPRIWMQGNTGGYTIANYADSLYITFTGDASYLIDENDYTGLGITREGGILKNGRAYLKVVRKNLDNITISANSTKDGTFSVTETGYTAIGVVGYDIDNASSGGTNMIKTVVSAVKINSGNVVYYQLANRDTNDSCKVRLWADVLYMSSDKQVV